MNPPKSNTGPLDNYQHAVENGQLQEDAIQREVIGKLQRLHQRLTKKKSAAGFPGTQKPAGFFASIFGSAASPSRPAAAPMRGLYLWGGVGRGKTLLCDMFFSSLPFEEKIRVHYHHFMREVHEQLASIKEQASPLEIVAERMSHDIRVLVLDEMHVNDITDAMLMAGLLDALFSRGVVLLTTSNYAPDDLYHDGLQRARFLPAIELLKRHTEVVYLGGDLDYRLRALQNAEIYHSPLTPAAEKSLGNYFAMAAGATDVLTDSSIIINYRPLRVKRIAGKIVWLDFAEVCEQPKATDDYIDIAEKFDTVLISEIPRMTAAQDDLARRFINMIDEFYDRSVNLLVSAAVPPSKLYAGERLAFEFNRTVSRLIEMQSAQYLEKRHHLALANT